MGAFMVPPAASLDRAHACDRDLGAGLMERLLKAGRGGHPAIAHLKVVLADKKDHDHLLHLAAVAFETAARLQLGQVAGAMAKDGRRHETAAPFLVDRTPTAWESSSRRPYVEVDWRRVVADTAEQVRQGSFHMPMAIPGAHLFVALRSQAAAEDAFLGMILGETTRDETLDPVATSGNFLAQAMPDYQDLDLLFRQHRETLIAREGEGD
jgi:hypothetical protein